MCCDGWRYDDSQVNGECPNCGTPTVDGEAQYGCNWSPVSCDFCGARERDDSC